MNYFAQGMYSAKYEGATIGQIIAHAWKYKEDEHAASEGLIIWLKEGYEFFQNQQNCFRVMDI